MERKFKVGERVKVKSLDWYNANKDEIGCICFNDQLPFCSDMKMYLSKEYIITNVTIDGYLLNLEDDEWYFAEDSLLSINDNTKDQYKIIINIDNQTFVTKQERNPVDLIKHILTGHAKWAHFVLEDNSTVYFGQDLLKKMIIKVIKEY